MLAGHRLLSFLTVFALVAACEPQAAPGPAPVPDELPEPPAEAPADGETRPRTVYVPAYSHLSRGEADGRKAMLSILLSVRNVDTSSSITLTHVDYYDTSGHRVRRYLAEPMVLRPLETAEFHVPTKDASGGSGANFLVYWEGPSDAHPLLTEAVMLGQVGAGFVSLSSRGVELDRRPDPVALQALPDDPAQVDGPATGVPTGEAAAGEAP